MADDRARKDRDELREAGDQPPIDSEATEVVDWSSWSNLWQVPSIIVSLIVIGIGLYVAMQRAPENDFDGAFDRVDELIAGEQFELAAVQLNEVIEPNLTAASQLQHGRFEATVADWIALSQKAAKLDLEANNRRVVDHYALAADLGLPLEIAQMERWAHAWISLGDLEAARESLGQMQKIAHLSGVGTDARRRRNNVLRRLVEVSLRRSDLSEESMMELLDGYRSDPLLNDADDVWAIARQAQLRIEVGRADEAVSHLLIEIRRFEPRLEQNPDLSFGELYALLARGYYAMGNFEHAEFHVGKAMDVIRHADPGRGEPLVLLGQIAVARGQWDEAFEFFEEVLRNYASTPSAIPARLGRAEVYSVLGDDDRSLADYRALQQALIDGGPRRDVTDADVAGSLSNRHDAALTMGRLDAALQYVFLAESVYPPGRVPGQLFYRIASTSRQAADNGIADARRRQPGAALTQLDPKSRYAANEHYRRAGDYFVRHARTLAGRPGADEHWADSLWMAADSYDLGGWNVLAITHFVEYVAGRSEADPRRPEAVFRLAQLHHADMDYEAATRYYDQVIMEHPRSHVASRSHVPLARCLLMLDRRPEAEQHLIQVVSGQQHLRPDAVDYRDALIELGTLYHDDSRYVAAIERLDEAVRRYPDDDRITEIRFRLGDSYRRHAASIDDDLDLPGVSPAGRDRFEKQRTQYLESAQRLFAAIVETDDGSAASGGPDARQILRYAYLYRADCAYDLDRYAEAVEYYDQVAGRFAQHHSSMTALIKIVNCYVSLGDTNRARTAHRRALVRLNKLPDEAFEEPDALLDRAAWEQWLKNMPVDDISTAAAGN